MLLTSFLHLPRLFDFVNCLDGVVGFAFSITTFSLMSPRSCVYCESLSLLSSVLVMERSELSYWGHN
jgi:hypothetical protein